MTAPSAPDTPTRRNGKSAEAFRTIAEVATELGLPQHVLRFWESKFQQVKPLKRGGGRRYYRPDDIQLLKRIQSLLHDDGFTIKGVQKLFSQNPKLENIGTAAAQPAAPNSAAATASTAASTGLSAGDRKTLQGALSELEDLRNLLRA